MFILAGGSDIFLNVENQHSSLLLWDLQIMKYSLNTTKPLPINHRPLAINMPCNKIPLIAYCNIFAEILLHIAIYCNKNFSKFYTRSRKFCFRTNSLLVKFPKMP